VKDVKEMTRHPQEDANPIPSLAPEEVIEIQLAALKYNDVPTKDHGISICFRFASPANKAATGPLPRFIRMIHNPLYECMINFQKSRFVPANVQGTTWQITITKDGQNYTFLWGMSRQLRGPFKNCWMTDTVQLVT